MMKLLTVCILLAASLTVCAVCGADSKSSSVPENPAAADAAQAVSETGSGASGIFSAASESPAAEDSFSVSLIPDDIFEKMQGKTYKDNCTVPREDLRYLRVLHRNLEGETLEGELVCHELIAEDLAVIFKELYEAGYPIEKIRLADEYDADDETSMSDNNSSCFNFRLISHTNRISKHGLGIAVDINPLYNPYTKVVDGERIIEPASAAPYLDRGSEFPYKLEEEDLCWQLFTSHGFEWGGSWNNRNDYQHFELPDSTADDLRIRYGS